MSPTESDSHIFVLEDDVWAMKGRFSAAVKRMEKVPWICQDDGEMCVHIVAESNNDFATTSKSTTVTPIVTPTSGTPAPSESALSLDDRHQSLITLLDIPLSLTARPKVSDLRLSYAKYKAKHSRRCMI
jgi:hypothetical protein